ncbi:MAG: right-handed parallel beta-helix repeat-containing protein [Wenzhouxiangella sp.]
MKQANHLYLVSAILACALTAPTDAAWGKTLRVDCDGPGSSQAAIQFGAAFTLRRALEVALPGDLIEVSGTCREPVTITSGPLTIDGDGSAVIDGASMPSANPEFNGLVTIDGASGVVLRGLTVRNSPGEGILAVNGASLVLEDSIVEANLTGMRLWGSSAELADSQVSDNVFGLEAYTQSSLVFRGLVDVSANSGERAGLFLTGNSVAEIRGGHLRANGNVGVGVVIAGHSTLQILGQLQAGQGSRLTASGNLSPGISIADGSLFVPGLGAPPGGIVITASGNAGPGIALLFEGRISSPFGAARFVLENNPVGLLASQGASVGITGGLQASNNFAAGVIADKATGLNLVSIPPNPAAIEFNGTDVILGFGTRSSIQNVTVGSIVCDPTVLSRGTVVCP